MISLIITILLFLVALLFFFGKCEFLISWMNTLPEEEKDNYDLKHLMKFTSKVLALIGVGTLLIYLSRFVPFFAGYGVVLILSVLFISLFYVNGKNRFMKK